MSRELLRAERISCAYAKRTILKEVSFSIFEGESVGLMGESGSGKSSLVRILLLLEKAGSGEIYFNGRNVREFNNREVFRLRQKMQVVFQDSASMLNPSLLVYFQVEEGLAIHFPELSSEARRERVRELLAKVGLDWELAMRLPKELSGGQRQRVSLARALAVEPHLILLDEPASQLDAEVQGEILKLLKELQETENLAYLFISHDEELVRGFCSRVLRLEDGRISERGSEFLGSSEALSPSPAIPRD